MLWTLLLFALALAYRRQCAPGEAEAAPLGGLRGRRPRLEQTRDHVIVVTEECSGNFHRAADSRLLGVTLQDVPPGIGTRRDMLAKYGLGAHG